MVIRRQSYRTCQLRVWRLDTCVCCELNLKIFIISIENSKLLTYMLSVRTNVFYLEPTIKNCVCFRTYHKDSINKPSCVFIKKCILPRTYHKISINKPSSLNQSAKLNVKPDNVNMFKNTHMFFRQPYLSLPSGGWEWTTGLDFGSHQL